MIQSAVVGVSRQIPVVFFMLCVISISGIQINLQPPENSLTLNESP